MPARAGAGWYRGAVVRIPMKPLVLSVAAMNCSVDRDGGDEGEGSTSGAGATEPAITTGAGETGEGEASSGGEASGGESSGGESSGGEVVDPDACDEQWARDYCETDEGKNGVRFCGFIAGKMQWGECLHSIVCWPGDVDPCDGYEDSYDYGYFDSRCTLDNNGVPRLEAGECGFTPLVLRIDDARVELAFTGGRGFDISGTGSCLASDWPTAATPWLALDRDGNGAIDDARELFGSGVVLDSGARARDGFEALAEFDADGDRRITAADPVWPALVLWSDHDGDRRSTGWELEPLAGRGVTELGLEKWVERACDERGNCEVERGRFTAVQGGRSVAGEVVDLHLACQ